MSSNILTDTTDRVAHIVLNRPDKKNALTTDMYRDLAQALADAEADNGVRAIFIHGQANCFCAGNDLNDFLNNPPHGEDAPVHKFLRGIASVTKPIVAAVGGPAVGVGTTMLLHCDLVYAAPDARFQLPFTTLGLVPEAASSLLLPFIAGYHRAAELLLLGRPFNVEKALQVGFLTDVIDTKNLLAHAENIAKSLAALPVESVRMTKSLMKQNLSADVATRMTQESELFHQRLSSPEAKEAFTAFLEKRKPDFSRF